MKGSKTIWWKEGRLSCPYKYQFRIKTLREENENVMYPDES
jgi:hypothetical protein